MSINIIVLISILINLCLNEDNTQSAPETIDDLTCGKDSPKKDTDCTKYGTGSGMLCCWVSSDESSDSGKCYMIPETKADKYNIDGTKKFESEADANKRYWSCGNKSSFININTIMLLLILFVI